MFAGAVISPIILWFILLAPFFVTLLILKKNKFNPERLYEALGWNCVGCLSVVTAVSVVANAVILGMFGLFIFTNLSQTSAFWSAFFYYSCLVIFEIYSFHIFTRFNDWIRKDCVSFTPLLFQLATFLIALAFANFLMPIVISQLIPYLVFEVIYHFWWLGLTAWITVERFWCCDRPRRHR